MITREFVEIARWWAGDLSLDPAEWRDATDAEVLEQVADWYPDGLEAFASDFAPAIEEARRERLAEEV